MNCLFRCFSKNWTQENSPYFDLKGTKVWAKCVNVYDGDTYQLVFRFQGKRWRWKCRCVGWDAPEIRTKNPGEKIAASAARQKMIEWWERNKWVAKVEIQGWDKYGRLLVHHSGLKEFMFESKLVRPYEGGHKEEWVEIM